MSRNQTPIWVVPIIIVVLMLFALMIVNVLRPGKHQYSNHMCVVPDITIPYDCTVVEEDNPSQTWGRILTPDRDGMCELATTVRYQCGQVLRTEVYHWIPQEKE